MGNVRNVFDFMLYGSGVYGRNRTEKPFRSKLVRVETGAPEPTEEELTRAVESALAEMRVKSATWRIMRNPVEVDTRDDGITWEKYVIHSSTCIARGSV